MYHAKLDCCQESLIPGVNREQLISMVEHSASERLLPPPSSTHQKRFPCVDQARGLAVILMLVADVAGPVIPSIGHAQWDGFHLADWVMPLFLVVVGASLALADRRPPSLVQVGWRAVKLFVLGVLLQGKWVPDNPIDEEYAKISFSLDLSSFRIMGILQRIAVCVLSVSLLTRLSSSLWVSRAGIFAMSVVFTYLTHFSKSSWSDCQSSDLSVECNKAGELDSLLMGGHLYNQAAVKGFDPEGLLTTLACIPTTWVGYEMGTALIKLEAKDFAKKGWVGGALLLVVAYGLSFFVPPNKKLWTWTYNFLGSGLSVLLLSTFSLLDSTALMQPLEWFGCNAILFFVFSDCSGLLSILLASFCWENHITGNVVTYSFNFLKWRYGAQEGAALYCLVQLLLWGALLRALHRRRLFWKV